MKTINFIARWAEDKRLTWSGIVWGLYTSLSKYYKIEDYDVSHVRPSWFFRKHKEIAQFFNRSLNDMSMSMIKETRNYIENIGLQRGIFFQFDESVVDSRTKQTYIFIDESVDHVLWMYDNQPDVFWKSNFADVNKRYLRKRRIQQNEYFRKCAGIFTLCHWLVDDLVNRTGISAEKVHYAGSGINVDVEKIDDSLKQGNKILFVGKNFNRKGGFHVVEAFKELLKKMPNAELYVAGPTENPISENIAGYHFLGSCNRNQLNDLYNKCDVFAMPSYFEAFGIVFVEALTFGLPCLVRRCQDMPYIIDHGKTGFVIDDDNVHVTANYLFTMLNDETFKQNVVSQREFFRSYYSWDTVARRIIDVIK